MKINNKKIAFVLAGIFLIVGIITLPHYGTNWDTINHLPRGQAYLHYFLTGNKNYNDLPESKVYWQKPENLLIDTNAPRSEVTKRSYYQINGMDFEWHIQNDGGHPPLSDILSSVFNYVFFSKLNLINDIDAYRIYGIFSAALLVGLIFFWVSNIYGKFAGLISALSLSLYPLYWAEAHFNSEKDIPETFFWGFMMFCVWKGSTLKNWKWILISGLFFGLALGTKFNILFSPLVFAPWVAVLIIPWYFKNKPSVKNLLSKNWQLALAAIIAPIIGIAIFFISWPYLWVDPIGRVGKILHFYKNIGLTQNINVDFLGPLGINTYPIQWILYTTPLIIIIFSIVGIIAAIFRINNEKNKISLLFLFWLIIPILRVTLPGTTIYGGVRQIMEYIPALAIFAGLGSLTVRNFIMGVLSRLNLPKILATIIIAIAFLPILVKIIQIHPNENVYFNLLIGGLSGAKEKDIPSWGNSFGAVYRQGITWLNQNAEYGSKIALTYELMPNLPQAWIRPDLNYSNLYRSGYFRQGEYTIGLIYDGTENRSYYEAYLESFIQPVYEVKVDDVAILKIWKNDDDHLINPWAEKIVQSTSFNTLEDSLRFDLGKIVDLSRLEISYDEDNCSPLSSLHIRISPDGRNWANMPGKLPQAWRIAALGKQPFDGKFLEPFVGQEARYIDLIISPKDSCITKIKDYKIYMFDNEKT